MSTVAAFRSLMRWPPISANGTVTDKPSWNFTIRGTRMISVVVSRRSLGGGCSAGTRCRGRPKHDKRIVVEPGGIEPGDDPADNPVDQRELQ